MHYIDKAQLIRRLAYGLFNGLAAVSVLLWFFIMALEGPGSGRAANSTVALLWVLPVIPLCWAFQAMYRTTGTGRLVALAVAALVPLLFLPMNGSVYPLPKAACVAASAGLFFVAAVRARHVNRR